MLKNSRAPYKCEQIANNQKTSKKKRKNEKTEKTKKTIAGHIGLQTIFACSSKKAASGIFSRRACCALSASALARVF